MTSVLERPLKSALIKFVFDERNMHKSKGRGDQGRGE